MMNEAIEKKAAEMEGLHTRSLQLLGDIKKASLEPTDYKSIEVKLTAVISEISKARTKIIVGNEEE